MSLVWFQTGNSLTADDESIIKFGIHQALRSVRSNRLTGRNNKKPATRAGFDVFGGSCEIRTHGGLAPSPVFKTGAFNRSATPPGLVQAPDFTTFILVEPQLTDRV